MREKEHFSVLLTVMQHHFISVAAVTLVICKETQTHLHHLFMNSVICIMMLHLILSVFHRE